jgi:hypothetical protein
VQPAEYVRKYAPFVTGADEFRDKDSSAFAPPRLLVNQAHRFDEARPSWQSHQPGGGFPGTSMRKNDWNRSKTVVGLGIDTTIICRRTMMLGIEAPPSM